MNHHLLNKPIWPANNRFHLICVTFYLTQVEVGLILTSTFLITYFSRPLNCFDSREREGYNVIEAVYGKNAVN
ncbi:hypothetical protein Desor_3883 [Desulfosporosinus orientis DSM 765]|uniref:Uncharacterized protein n=1 Tax=Desulfosporosinus orientis (strain ATCC 19365 / DSM 765 / NCIMB 8382 / VKM B-1628 / Singapore I) TaxID=768706 RepID=G7WBT5_DESOD|nr:hypothetical protein Desor_3883 [Desulfosporosinus orientis DSM 765]